MPLFMIEWTSTDVKATTSMFSSGLFPLPLSLKLVSSVHVVGQPKGFALLDGSADDIYALVLSLPPGVLQIEVSAVIDDIGAKKGLEHRNSAYKIK